MSLQAGRRAVNGARITGEAMAGEFVGGPHGGILDARIALPRTRVRTRGGWVATAAFDEDVVTLGARALLPLLDAHPDVRPRSLLLATVSSPLVEGGVAQLLAEVCGLAGDRLHVAEQGGTVAAAGAALTSALALDAAGLGPVLLVTADTRRDTRGGALGDGAAAALVGGDGDLAQVEVGDSSAELFRDRWRLDGQHAVREAESSLVKAAPRPAGADVAVDAFGPRVDRAGALGCAGLLTGVLLRLADAESGTRLTVRASGGGVSHAFTLTAGPAARAAGAAAAEAVAGGTEGAAPGEVSVEGFDPYASQARAWRERGRDLRLEAVRDAATGEVLFPAPPGGNGAAVQRLARRGRVYTHTRDHVFPYGGPLSMAVVDLDGGGRFYGQVADGAEVAIGDEVELVLRRLHTGGGVPQYFYKVVPRADVPAAAAREG